jgi:electron transport complex protein RnfG
MKKVLELLKNTLILLLITIIAGGLLGYVFEVTKGPIALKEEQLKNEACKLAFKNADNFIEVMDFDLEQVETILVSKGYESDTIQIMYLANDKENNLLGYVFKIVTHEGYNGDISFMMGIALDGTVEAISILSISETPGLGMRAAEVIASQIEEINVDYFEYTKTGAMTANQIDAISGATITTNAITNGLNAGISYFDYLIGGGDDE